MFMTFSMSEASKKTNILPSTTKLPNPELNLRKFKLNCLTVTFKYQTHLAQELEGALWLVYRPLLLAQIFTKLVKTFRQPKR